MNSVICSDKKTAIVLFNLGGPDTQEAVEPFLHNLFSDPAIISLPSLLRKFIAKKISRKRAPLAREIYTHLGGGSPLLANTLAQADALSSVLETHGQVRVFICMRYWHPMSEEVATQVKAYQPDHLILLPLYPQYSTTTTASSFTDWHKACDKVGLNIATSKICCYPTQPHWISAQAELIEKALNTLPDRNTARILFSAHGLPEKIIRKGDPYQWQVEATTRAIIEQLSDTGVDTVNCYQSRVGPLKWIGPSTEEEIDRAAADGKDIVLVPVAFVSEHSETLVELDIEYRERATHAGVRHYVRVPTVSVHRRFILALAELCLSVTQETDICSESGTRVCPSCTSKCPMKKTIHKGAAA